MSRSRCKVEKVDVLPQCDFCDKPARYNAPTLSGTWANLCPKHYITLRMRPDTRYVLRRSKP